MKLKFLADTSFLISATLIDIIPKLLKTDEIITTEQVRSELLRISKYRDPEGLSAKACIRFIKSGQIKVVKFKSGKILGLGKGESSCIRLFKKLKFDALCIDDIDAIKKISEEIGKNNIVTIFDIIQYLTRLRVFNKNKSKKLVQKLLNARKWEASRSIIELAKKRGLI